MGLLSVPGIGSGTSTQEARQFDMLGRLSPPAGLNTRQIARRLRRTVCLPNPPLLTSLSIAIPILFLAITLFGGNQVDAQIALNDPLTQYIEGRLGNRRVFWCPSGYGYLPYCPQPTDWIIIASIILVAVLIGLSCWCCYCCPLYKQLYEYEEEELVPPAREFHEGGVAG